MKKHISCMIGMLFFNFSIIASEKLESVPSTSEMNTQGLTHTLFVFAVTIGLIGLMTWLLKRINPKIKMKSYSRKIINQITLGQRERIAVVEIEGQKLIVGITNSNISLLKDITDLVIEKNAPQQSNDQNNQKPTETDQSFFEKLIRKGKFQRKSSKQE